MRHTHHLSDRLPAEVFLALGESDCERLRDGALAQPVATWTSLAYVVAAVVVVVRVDHERDRRRALLLAALLVVVAAGSVLFHGPQPAVARWVHDLAVIGLVAWMVACTLDRSVVVWAASITAVGVVLALVPEAGLAAVVVAITGLLGAEVARYGWTREQLPAFTLAGVGLLAQVLGRTGGALCDADGALQLHGLWHLLTATAVVSWSAAMHHRGS